MAVRTARLAARTITSGAVVTAYTCAAGTITIVKSCIVTNRAGASQSGLISLQKPGGGTDAFVSLVERTFANNETFENSHYAVMLPDDILALFCDVGRMDFWISGTILSTI